MPTPALFHSILAYAIQMNASDVHLVSGLSPKIRLHGEIQNTNFPILLSSSIQNILDNIMSEKSKEFLKMQGEVDFAFVDKVHDKRRYRVNVFYQNQGLSAVFRILPLFIPTFESLNLPETIKEIALLSQGLVLITGPTGSGKTTTLAATVQYRNLQKKDHIITLEDPIEFVHTSKNCLITQREIGRDSQGFHCALRSALRADPNVILIGELRDLETIRLALTAAETGHLVLATLHTSSAEKTIHRILDVFPGDEKEAVRSLLSESLEAVISQTLVKTSYNSRVPVLEILRCTPAIRNLIRENKIPQIISAMQTGEKLGMQTRDQHLVKLSKNGIIS